MLSVIYKAFMLTVIMLNVVMLSVKYKAFMLNAVMPNAVMVNDVMLSVVALRLDLVETILLIEVFGAFHSTKLRTNVRGARPFRQLVILSTWRFVNE
jgi:hypothetical protein